MQGERSRYTAMVLRLYRYIVLTEGASYGDDPCRRGGSPEDRRTLFTPVHQIHGQTACGEGCGAVSDVAAHIQPVKKGVIHTLVMGAVRKSRPFLLVTH